MTYQKKEQPLISFITPNYNDGDTIEAMVDSIMSQDYPNIEQIIVDDGSTDNSKEVLEKLENKYDRLQVIYLKKNQGACVARNIGTEQSKGKYLSFLPADAKLYPGVARIWVEGLERHPEYDFMYGGYKFVDEHGHEVMAYMSEDFDPYFLEVTNYIDGSYPLKRELFDKMGGWDPKVKSLQDWDFWINAVKVHGAKGFYSKQVFFETTMPHPGGLSDDSNRNWIERLNFIKKKYGITQKQICVTGQGATFHAKNVAKYLKADYLPLPSFKPHNYEMIYIVGFFGNVEQSLHNTRALRVVHWIGSDILGIKNAPEDVRKQTLDWIDNNIDVNLCELEVTQKELAEFGIKARIVPFPPKVLGQENLPLPSKFSVAVYDPYVNKEFYYSNFIREFADKHKDIDWHFFGDPTLIGHKDNVHNYGIANEEEIKEIIAKTSCILRLTPHDGLPLSVVEWITAGRNAITSIKIPYAVNFKLETYSGDKEPNKKQLDDVVKKNEENLKETLEQVSRKGINEEGATYYREVCSPETFKENIYKLLNVDIEDWWKQMSELWGDVENGQIEADDMFKAIKKIKELKPDNIIDIGCGTGRWCDILPDVPYKGIDFMPKLIEQAKAKHPEKDFEVASIEAFAETIDNKYDLAFTFASLLHIPPKELKQTVEALKKIAKRAVFIEPIREASVEGKGRTIHPKIIQKQKDTDFIFNVKYTWCHDYIDNFEVEQVIPMSNNRAMYVIKL